MIACKDADAMVTGNIRHYAASIEKLKYVVEARPGEEIFGMTMIVSKGKTILVADTNVQDFPSSERLVNVSKLNKNYDIGAIKNAAKTKIRLPIPPIFSK